MVESFLHHSPEFCFVVEDTSGAVCAYVLSAVDAAAFYEKVKTQWLSEVVKKYEDIAEKDSNFSSEVCKIIRILSKDTGCCIEISDFQYCQFFLCNRTRELEQNPSPISACEISIISFQIGVVSRTCILAKLFLKIQQRSVLILGGDTAV